MKRTNINLAEDQHDYLKALAHREGKSISEIIRQLIGAFQKKQTESLPNDPIYDVIGLGRSDGKISAKDHDEMLYPKRRT